MVNRRSDTDLGNTQSALGINSTTGFGNGILLFDLDDVKGSIHAQREPRRKPAMRRHAHSAAYKLQVVRQALQRPASNRIKPTCRLNPGIEPVCAPHPLPPPSALLHLR